jgi:segregation and condensation protein A
MNYQVKLEVFEGPLDLLLNLIKEQEVDIYDIPITQITQQYLEYIDLMRELNLEIAGEFLVMAATLTQIKSKMLLPPPHEETEGEDEGEDPRAELVRRLLEYQKYKDAARKLRERESVFANVYGRDAPLGYEGMEEDVYLEVSMFDLLSALKKVLDDVKERGGEVIELDELRVTDRINQVLETLSESSPLSFSALFEDAFNKIDVIVTFLAILELIRLKMVRVRQGTEFGNIWVFLPDA